MISWTHRTIFVHIPKCAGQSVETAFLNDLNLTWQTRTGLLLRPNDDPKAGPPRLAHLAAADYVRCGHVSAEEFEKFLVFSTVRNPFTRTVSLYRHLRPNQKFRDWVTEWLSETITREGKDFWFVRPQADFLTGPDGIIVDKVLRFETIREDFAGIAQSLRLDPCLPRVNESGSRTAPDRTRKRSLVGRAFKAVKKALTPERFETHSETHAYLDDASRSAIAKLYARDFALFGYGGKS